MRRAVRWRLAAMMALVYAVQGAWWPLLAVHLRDLGISSRGRGWIFATMALACLATPLGAGQLADRLMPAQYLLGLVYLMGTGLLALLAFGGIAQTGPLFLLFLVYWLLTAPAIALSNALAMRNLPRPREQFGSVRLWGTVGWMVVGWVVSGVLAYSGSARAGHGAFEAFVVGAGLSLLLALFCLNLPHTPPLSGHSPGPNPLGALGLVRKPAVAIYLAIAFGVSLTTPFVYQVIPAFLESRGLARAWIPSAMTLGQLPEIGALAVLPWLFQRFGYRGTLAIGIGAWVLRYGSLMVDPPLWVGVAGIPLHGVGIACFAIAGQVFLDSEAPADRRASAQALYVVVTSGVGSLLGSVLAGESAGWIGPDAALVFLVPCLINLGLLVYLCQGFRPSATPTGRGAVVISLRPPVCDVARKAVVRVGNLGAESGDG